MIAALILACLPMPAGYPTPVISWSHALIQACDSTACTVPDGRNDELDGFRVFAWTGAAYTPVWDLPCWVDADDGIKRCRNSFPVQRGGPWDLLDVQFMVKAYNAYGESQPSAPLTICMPHIWRPGEAYQ